MSRVLALFSVVLILSGCTAIKEWEEDRDEERAERKAEELKEWQGLNCNYEAAYRQGINDGKNRRDMDGSYSTKCPEDIRATVEKAYREGYTLGLKNASSSTPTQQDPAESFRLTCILNGQYAEGYIYNLQHSPINYNGRIYMDLYDSGSQFTRRDSVYDVGTVQPNDKVRVVQIRTRSNERYCKIDITNALQK